MFIPCTNKGCYEETEALLDTESNVVNCTTCGNEIKVPQTTKATLKSLGQIKRQVKSGIHIECAKCGYEDRPLLQGSNAATAVVCRKCKEPLKVHGSLIQALKLMKDQYGENLGDQDNI